MIVGIDVDRSPCAVTQRLLWRALDARSGSASEVGGWRGEARSWLSCGLSWSAMNSPSRVTA